MATRPDLGEVIDRRVTAAEALLRAALRLDLQRFLSSEVELRLRARPSFLADTAPQVLAQLRRRMERDAEKLAAEIERKVHDLRVYYGVSPADEAAEAAALTRVLSRVGEVTAKLLRDYAVPGDEKPDDPEDRALDLDRSYRVTYAPSDVVLWAWRQVRGLDTARNQVADAAGGPPEDTFEVRFFLPDALPPRR